MLKRFHFLLEITGFTGEEVVRCKGIARCLQIHATLKVTLCCAHKLWCKHRDKPWFSWHPAAADHWQNEQKNKCMVKRECQSMLQQRRMINTNQPEFKMRATPLQSVQLPVCQSSGLSQYISVTVDLHQSKCFGLSQQEKHQYLINIDPFPFR